MAQDFSGTQSQQAQGHSRGGSQGQVPQKAIGVITAIREDIRSLSSSILIITQKMKYLVRNEKILGRNLIVLNKKISGLEDKLSSGQFSSGTGLGSGDAEAVVARLEEMNKKILELEAQFSQLRGSAASQEQLQELKYIIDSINPLEFTTLSQVRDMIDERLEKAKKK
ncbi:MAG: hypothetical protein PHD95_06695 [Candidatus ainarchaeum sp.]|nr:hypothetical protein [Candidatus ainarchaeum sp.]